MTEKPTDALALPLWRQFRDAQRITAGEVLAHFGVIAPPVDVADVAKRLGIYVHGVPKPGWSGAVDSDETHAVIWLDLAETVPRRRFTIAHEIGHLLIHGLGRQFRDVLFEVSTNPQETEANAFAADLLMPLWLLRPLADEYGHDVPRLAEIFEVSEPAMHRRIREVSPAVRTPAWLRALMLAAPSMPQPPPLAPPDSGPSAQSAIDVLARAAEPLSTDAIDEIAGELAPLIQSQASFITLAMEWDSLSWSQRAVFVRAVGWARDADAEMRRSIVERALGDRDGDVRDLAVTAACAVDPAWARRILPALEQQESSEVVRANIRDALDDLHSVSAGA